MPREKNYHTITLALPRENRSLEVMLHSVLPYTGARVRASDDGDPLYTDCPFAPDECAPLLIITPSFTILPASLLNAPIRPTPEPWMQPLIDPAAWDDLHYFKPRRIGDFVFNNYD